MKLIIGIILVLGLIGGAVVFIVGSWDVLRSAIGSHHWLVVVAAIVALVAVILSVRHAYIRRSEPEDYL